MNKNCDRSKFYFISIRDPLDQYLSLFSFGCQTDGQLYQRLEKKGLGDFYDGTWSGFRSWLDFILEPENASLLGAGYGKRRTGKTSELIGYQSYRVLSLAIPQASKLMAECETRDSMKSAYKTFNLVNYTIRHESFRSGLTNLINTKLRSSVTNVDEAIRFIEAESPRNSSDRIDRYESNPQLGRKLRRRLEEREWLMYEEFGY